MKKGEISSGMLVGIIIVVVTLVILILIFINLIEVDNVDRETCKLSSIMRGAIPEGELISQTKELVKLNCKTKKVCVTTESWPSKGRCEEVFGTKEKYVTYRIEKNNREKAELQIMAVLAREMADCWDMLGRGNLGIFARELTFTQTFSVAAVICSRIHFDRTITEDLGIKEVVGFNKYLLTHKVPNEEISYFDFLRNAYHGETMSLIFDTKNDFSQEDLNNVISLTNTKAVLYVEATSSSMGSILGKVTGGLIGFLIPAKVAKGAVYKIAGKGGLVFLKKRGLTYALKILSPSFLGGSIGDIVQRYYMNKEYGWPEDANFVSSIFLIDYTPEGFEKFREVDGFAIASYA